MPWKDLTTMSQRTEMVSRLAAGEQPVSHVCEEYGISRKTAYKWLARYRSEGEAGLQERSRRPHHSPERSSEALEQLIVQARQQHPTWGARKLKAWLLRQGQTALPACSTITAILRRYDLLNPQAQRFAYTRFERNEPNALWQMDFKGDWEMTSGQRCYPLTVLDDHSRFLLCLSARTNTRRMTVQAVLTEVFEEYGLPERMLMDNGSPWGSAGAATHTRLSVWLLRLGIAVSHGRPYHPQTQGKDERLHRTLNEDVVLRCSAQTLPEWQAAFDAWRVVYNTERPHQSLGDHPPVSRYHASPRPFPHLLPNVEYPSSMQVRRVDITGRVSFQGKRLRLGKAFAHQSVGLRFDPLVDGRLQVFFGRFCIRTIDLS
jgi:transposase InsO family protein